MVMEALAETYDFVVLAVLDEERPAARALALALAPRADQAVIAFDPAASAPDVSALRDALREAGAGDVLAARLNSAQAQIMAA